MLTKLKNIFKFNQDKEQKVQADGEHLETSSQKRLAELQLANEQLQQKIRQLQQVKDEFLNIAAHDLRTPVTAIKGYTDMILSGDFGKVPVKLQEPLDELATASKRMALMISDFLTISRIERGKITIKPQKTNIIPILKSIANQIKPLADKKNLQFYTSELPNELWVKTDPNKIQEVIINLLDNAIKYTEKGSITMNIKKTTDGAVLTVTDTGKGITPEQQKKLFNKYYQATGSKVVEGKGTGLGLGLYISHLIVKGCDGKIWCESQAGKGSKFSFSLPLIK